MYPCSLCWKDNSTLIVGWGSSIKVCVSLSVSVLCVRVQALCACVAVCVLVSMMFSFQICSVKERDPAEMRDLPSRYVEIGEITEL